MSISIKNKILEHLDGLNEVERKQGSDAMIETLSQRYDVPENIVRQAIAEWSAGREISGDKNNAEE